LTLYHNDTRSLRTSTGTKNHQQVRQAIKKRKPAFLSAIRRFNKICTELKEMLKPEWNIPVPEPLPTDVHELRDESHLMEDVWIERTVGATPRWIESPEVRRGIRSMLILDRCKEERLRLGKEADTMCRWFGDELMRTELAIADPTSRFINLFYPRSFAVFVHRPNTPPVSDQPIRRCLENHRTRLLLCEPKWSGSPAVSKTRYQHHLDAARKTTERVSSALNWGSETIWLPVVEHHTHLLDFDSVTFAGDDEAETALANASPNPFRSDPSLDADAADLPDSEALMLQDMIEDEAQEEAQDSGDEENGVELAFDVLWVSPVRVSTSANVTIANKYDPGTVRH
jgi:hypothetical protein